MLERQIHHTAQASRPARCQTSSVFRSCLSSSVSEQNAEKSLLPRFQIEEFAARVFWLRAPFCHFINKVMRWVNQETSVVDVFITVQLDWWSNSQQLFMYFYYKIKHMHVFPEVQLQFSGTQHGFLRVPKNGCKQNLSFKLSELCLSENETGAVHFHTSLTAHLHSDVLHITERLPPSTFLWPNDERVSESWSCESHQTVDVLCSLRSFLSTVLRFISHHTGSLPWQSIPT